MRLDLIRQQMQDLLIDLAGILADLQEIMAVGCKAGDIIAVFIHPVFTFVFLVVHVLAHLEMMHFLILADGDRVIFHIPTTN